MTIMPIWSQSVSSSIFNREATDGIASGHLCFVPTRHRPGRLVLPASPALSGGRRFLYCRVCGGGARTRVQHPATIQVEDGIVTVTTKTIGKVDRGKVLSALKKIPGVEERGYTDRGACRNSGSIPSSGGRTAVRRRPANGDPRATAQMAAARTSLLPAPCGSTMATFFCALSQLQVGTRPLRSLLREFRRNIFHLPEQGGIRRGMGLRRARRSLQHF